MARRKLSRLGRSNLLLFLALVWPRRREALTLGQLRVTASGSFLQRNLARTHADSDAPGWRRPRRVGVGARHLENRHHLPQQRHQQRQQQHRMAANGEGEAGGLNGDGDGVALPRGARDLVAVDSAPVAMDNVLPVELNSELQTSFMQYAMSIILGRALPDVRDGLKPVHRRILYAMHALGLQPESTYRKCARVVGEVLGKFHPHGDVAVYDALVRMAQDFVMGAPLVAGHGNFGSVDADPPAAMRYTECKLTPLARDALLADVALDTVNFAPNFDGNEREPVVLPARLPVLLLNGATGIAVGMATNIPPHNLGEIVAATVALVKDPALSDEQLFRLVPAPDFPSGGCIMGLAGARKLYTTSNGGVTLRATYHIEAIDVGRGRPPRNAVVVTEMPYMVNKAALLERIAEMVNEKKLEGIADLRDESDREGIRMVIELKRDAVPQVIVNNLFKRTQLQTSFSGNMLALAADGKQPQRYTLRGLLLDFIDFRFKTLRRRSNFQLTKVAARDHIVQGMLLALGKIDDVIELVRRSKDTATARAALMGEGFGLSTEQADAILGLRLGRLTALEEKKLREEHEELSKEAARLGALMSDDSQVNDLMVAELLELKRQHAVPRRTILKPDEGELSEEDLLANDRSVVVVTGAGYIKRMPLGEFAAQNRGTRGKAGAKMSDGEDLVEHFLSCQDHDTLLFISDRGVAYGIRGFQVPLASRTAKGVPVPQVLPLAADEKIATIIPVSSFDKDDEYLVLLTKRGYIKKTPLAAFASLTARGLIIITLEPDDSLRWVKRCFQSDSVIIGTEQGFATRFLADSEQLRPTGRTSRGVKAMKYRPEDYPVDMDILPGDDTAAAGTDDRYLLVVTSQGYGKRVPSREFRVQRRGGMGVTALKFKAKSRGDRLACLRVVGDEDEIMLITGHGTIVRQRAGNISGQSRLATGVLVQRTDNGDEIARVALVPAVVDGEQLLGRDEEEEEEEDGARARELAAAA